MKVLVVNQHKQDSLGGSEIQCDIISNKLTEFGHDVVYFAVGGSQDSYHTEYPVEPGGLNTRDLSSVLKNYSPEIVYWRYNKKKFLQSAALFKYFDTKIVFGVSSKNDVDKWLFSSHLKDFSVKSIAKFGLGMTYTPLKHRINHFGYHFIDGLTTLNSDFLDEVPCSQQMVLRNSMPTDVEPFDWPDPFVFWVANLKPKKNPELFIELAKHFESKDIDFLMVGAIQDLEYQYVLNEKELPENFFYLGQKTPKEVNGILAESMFLVHTCDPEGFGNNFIQAWLQGRPTISAFFDPDNTITDEKLGFVSGDFEQLVSDTATLIEDESLRNEMGQRAKEYALANFNPESNIRDLEAFFHQILAE